MHAVFHEWNWFLIHFNFHHSVSKLPFIHLHCLKILLRCTFQKLLSQNWIILSDQIATLDMMQTVVNSENLFHSLNLNISHGSTISDTIIRHWVRNDTLLPHWCIFGAETLHVPATLFDSLEMGLRFMSLRRKRASHTPARSLSLSLKSWFGCKWITTLELL